MKCQYHPDNDSIGICITCGRAICSEDMNLVDNRYICHPCYRERKKPLLKKKSPGLTILFNCLPGGGYLYLGQYIKALIVFLTFFALIEMDGGVLVAALFAYVFIDGYRQAKLINADLYQEDRKPSPAKGTLYLGFALVIIGGFLTLNELTGIDLSWLAHWWPLALVGIGVWQILTALKAKEEEAEESDVDALVETEEPAVGS